jgi:hypothetical protein
VFPQSICSCYITCTATEPFNFISVSSDDAEIEAAQTQVENISRECDERGQIVASRDAQLTECKS